ncbi:MAG: DUF2189 domain-containing protein [Rhodocyclaceae bacterium]|nr:DUF2189 domain-containing protein [Rhodocyclaceae bacterium]
MDKPFHSLDRHFDVPRIALVEHSRPLAWLRAGWQDLVRSPAASLAYGIVFAALGYLIMAYAIDKPYLGTAAVSGFMLIGPIAAAGLYEISRRHEAGEPAGLFQSLSGLRGHRDGLFTFGIMLAFLLIVWERLSAMLFALFYRGDIPDVSNFYSHVLFSGDYVYFIVAYLVIGGALAALVFALTAVAVPMVMDRDTDTITAMMTSLRAMGTNLGAMASWAVIIVLLMAISFATKMIGMVVLLPLLGHATWHAYRDQVER